MSFANCRKLYNPTPIKNENMMGEISEIGFILWRSVLVSFLGTLIACLLALPLAVWVAKTRFWGRGFLLGIMQALMGMPPVLVGLGLYLLFRPQGFLGDWGWLYSLRIMVLAQIVLVVPIVFSLSVSALQIAYERIAPLLSVYPKDAAIARKILLFEARPSLNAAVLAGFGRAIGEVGAVLIVGGNIKGHSSVLTTVIVEETSKGNLQLASYLGLVLLFVALIVSVMAMGVLRRNG